MIEAARKYNRMVQVGSQSRSMTHKIKAMELLHQGVIGKVYLAKGLCFKWRPSIGHKPDEPTPLGLDWDKFLGPAPMRPYNQNRRNITGTGSGTPATATWATRASTRWTRIDP